MTDWESLTSDMGRVPRTNVPTRAAITMFEDAAGIALPEGLIWLEQQPFSLWRKFAYWHVPDGKGEPEAPACETIGYSHPVVRPESVPHHWNDWIKGGALPPVYSEWIPKLIIFWVDDYNNTYSLDYNFDVKNPPVVYSNWSEGTGLKGCADMTYIADSFRAFIMLPERRDGTDDFTPPRPERVDEWKTWMEKRVTEAAAEETDPSFL